MSFEKKSASYRHPYTDSSPGHTEALAYTGGEIDGAPAHYHDTDVFGHEEGHDIKYKTLSWQLVAVLMIAEIVSNGKYHYLQHCPRSRMMHG